MIEYVCSYCKNIYKSSRSIEVAKQEREAVWGKDVQTDDVIVCNDCFQKIREFHFGKIH